MPQRLLVLVLLVVLALGGVGVGTASLIVQADQARRIAALEATTGTADADGADGVDGTAGANGRDGVDGTDGRDGARGERGPQGPSGATGATGAKGPMGATGATGATGPTGPTGPAGAAGQNSVRHIDSWAWGELGPSQFISGAPAVNQGAPSSLNIVRTTQLVTIAGDGTLAFTVQRAGVYLVSYSLVTQEATSRIDFGMVRNPDSEPGYIPASRASINPEEVQASASFYAEFAAGEVVQLKAIATSPSWLGSFPAVSFQAIDVEGLD